MTINGKMLQRAHPILLLAQFLLMVYVIWKRKHIPQVFVNNGSGNIGNSLLLNGTTPFPNQCWSIVNQISKNILYHFCYRPRKYIRKCHFQNSCYFVQALICKDIVSGIMLSAIYSTGRKTVIRKKNLYRWYAFYWNGSRLPSINVDI